MLLNRTRRLVRQGVAVIAVAAMTITNAFATSTVTYFHNDISGTPQIATDASGAVAWKESYQPFGGKLINAPASADNKIWFADKPYDATSGLSYFGARYYDPVSGRFMGVDPNQADFTSPHSFNRYAYGNNNPYKYVDEDGKSAALALLVGVTLVWMIGATYYGSQSPAQQAEMRRAAARMFSMSSSGGDSNSPPAANAGPNTTAAGGSPDPNDPNNKKSDKKADLKQIHPEETIKSGSNRYSYDYWNKQSTDDIVKSLRPGQEEPLTVKPDGRIFQGNTRTSILQQRGFDINTLPRVNIP